MGFIGNAFKAIGRLFGGGGPSYMPPPTLTARDILGRESVESEAPKAIEYGQKTKRRGRSALLVKPKVKDTENNSYNGLNV